MSHYVSMHVPRLSVLSQTCLWHKLKRQAAPHAYHCGVVPGECTFPLLMTSTRPSRLPKFPDQARLSSTTAWSGLYATCFQPSPLVCGRVNDRVAVDLIEYRLVQKCYLDHTRSLCDHFPINSRSTRPIPDYSQSLLEHLPTRSLLDFFDSQK